MVSKLTARNVERLIEILGSDNVLTTAKDMEDYTHDMADYEALPAVVVKPRSELQVAEVVELAAEFGLPIVARGAGSSLTGAAVLDDGIVLDMRNMVRVLKIDTVNWYAHVQPGLSLEDLNKELKPYGFFFPPDPASSYICTVGGAIAEGSGGLRCVRYGTMKDWVLALRVVLPNGTITKFGEPLAKNRAGYDLVHLMVGSEGTLGIITEAWLKIIPIPSARNTRLLVTFGDWESVGEVIKQLRSLGILPNLFEFMDKDNIRALNEKLGMSYDEAEATLLVDLEDRDFEQARKVFDNCGALKTRVAHDDEEAEAFYQARSMAYLAVKTLATGVKVEDLVLPIDKLTDYLKFIKQVADKYRMIIPVNGHAGDGNVHPIILYERGNEQSESVANNAFEEMCRHAISIGGSITGEHGVGLQKPRLLREQLMDHDGAGALTLMKGVKALFDPKGIMNPGKYVELA